MSLNKQLSNRKGRSNNIQALQKGKPSMVTHQAKNQSTSNQQGHLPSFPPGFPPMPYPTKPRLGYEGYAPTTPSRASQRFTGNEPQVAGINSNWSH
ncbi:unnamed protein product [Microthlaspi erraticum]|uniref:Uncharacterized protein n=1 Tax=Microthlaspi erraticum TaxID=1685480 RepID=A0A6D2JLP6_9BRAS|nr:unnamed protein product [Microthlaspi erraticum]